MEINENFGIEISIPYVTLFGDREWWITYNGKPFTYFCSKKGAINCLKRCLKGFTINCEYFVERTDNARFNNAHLKNQPLSSSPVIVKAGEKIMVRYYTSDYTYYCYEALSDFSLDFYTSHTNSVGQYQRILDNSKEIHENIQYCHTLQNFGEYGGKYLIYNIPARRVAFQPFDNGDKYYIFTI